MGWVKENIYKNSQYPEHHYIENDQMVRIWHPNKSAKKETLANRTWSVLMIINNNKMRDNKEVKGNPEGAAKLHRRDSP